jgi:hypothetical protein
MDLSYFAIGLVSWMAGWVISFYSLLRWGRDVFIEMDDDEFIITSFSWSFWWPITSIGLVIILITKKIKK